MGYVQSLACLPPPTPPLLISLQDIVITATLQVTPGRFLRECGLVERAGVRAHCFLHAGMKHSHSYAHHPSQIVLLTVSQSMCPLPPVKAGFDFGLSLLSFLQWPLTLLLSILISPQLTCFFFWGGGDLCLPALGDSVSTVTGPPSLCSHLSISTTSYLLLLREVCCVSRGLRVTRTVM